MEQFIEEVKAAFPDAELVEVRDIGIPWCDAFDRELEKVRAVGERMRFYLELRWVAMELERKMGWAAFFYKDVHGEWPPWDWKELRPLEPSEATLKLVRRRDRLAREAWKAKKEQEREERDAGRSVD